MLTIDYCKDIIYLSSWRVEDTSMKISTKSIVSNSDMIKNYKNCREKADLHGRIFILKNNQPDAVLFSISEYEKLSVLLEQIEGLDEHKIVEIAGTIKL
jgi:PHD/YefM family antitoxin component YafN of YafNO toxin-antitoxin module